ncbi:MAG: methyltransferase domain-containing protein [Burkholderiales bacterium]|nr:methyltransferase domain-containing protein [Burkholderiales bacterium]
MEIEQAVARHYAHGSLEETILDALAAAGKDIKHLKPKDLSPVDEFHVGGRQATTAFAEQFGLRPGMRLLDIGCGLGGAARYFAHEHGCQVSGIDLSAEYVNVANALAARVGLEERVSCEPGSALALPFEPGGFDAAYMLHVGMNIEDKARLFAEVRRVLKPAGLFGIYDVMRLAAGDLSYPVPWASGPESSFVADAASYRRLLAAAGFEVLQERDRRDFALDVFAQMRARGAGAGPAPLGLHIVMGANAGQKVKNMIADISAGLIAPTELICRVP